LAGVEGRAVHQPWTLGAERLAELGYPPPIVEHDQAAAAWRAEHGPKAS
jgi:deoxyribodipyrimidine photolyase